MRTIVISLGGSVLAPAGIDTDFLGKFHKLILRLSKSMRFVIICGGGKTARDYMNAASTVVNLTPDDLDWIGIHATRLNAQLLRDVFREVAYRRIIKNPTSKISTDAKVIVAAGWKPGRSTDHIAVILAKKFGATSVVNITNIDYVYDMDPSQEGAKPITKLKWADFRKIIGPAKWSPGLNSPFDPVAARDAQKLDLQVAIMGKNLNNLEQYIQGTQFKGTLISP